MASAAASIEKFTRRHGYGPDADQVTKFILKHSPKEGKPVTVQEWKFDKAKTDLELLATEADELSTEHAQGMGGEQRFELWAEYPSGPRKLVFRVYGGESDGDGASPTDQANLVGAFGMQLRHNKDLAKQNEELIRHMMSTSADTNKTLTRLVETSQAQVETLMAERIENISVIERMLNLQNERELQNKAAERSGQRQDQFLKQLTLLLPTAVNKIVGRRVLPETISPELEMIQTLFGTLQEDQIEKLMGVLNPAQAITVMELYKSFLESKEKKTEPAAEEAKPNQPG
jgi:hypothetical protein